LRLDDQLRRLTNQARVMGGNPCHRGRAACAISAQQRFRLCLEMAEVRAEG
jgi:hypothetical protein